jgi:hypothetical protein
VSNIDDITDAFNCYDAYPLLIMLKVVYIPEIVIVAEKEPEQASSAYKNVALNLFNTMITIFKTNI